MDAWFTPRPPTIKVGFVSALNGGLISVKGLGPGGDTADSIPSGFPQHTTSGGSSLMVTQDNDVNMYMDLGPSGFITPGI